MIRQGKEYAIFNVKNRRNRLFNSQIFNILVDSDAINYLIYVTQRDKWFQELWNIPLQNQVKEKKWSQEQNMKKNKEDSLKPVS